MTNPAQNEVRFPPEWEQHLLPRRGRRTGGPVVLDPEAPKVVQGLINWYDPELRQALDNPKNSPYADAGRAHLDGEADPRGAGIVASFLVGSEKRRSASILRPELDAWIIEHGLPFAVCATITRLTLHGWLHYRSHEKQVAHRVLGEASVAWDVSFRNEISVGITVLRSLLATAADEEYAAVVASVGAHRGSRAQRLIATFLLPDEHDWATEVCAEYAQHRTGYQDPDPLLWYAIDDPSLLADAGLREVAEYQRDLNTAAAIVDNLGPESLTILAATLRRKLSPEYRRTLLRGIAIQPTESAVRYLIGHITEPFVAEAATEFAERFPIRFLSGIVQNPISLSPERAPRVAAIARKLDIAAWEHLTEPERGALEDFLDSISDAPEADPKQLPPLLTAPPWTKERPKRKQVVIEGLTPPEPGRLHWTDEERKERESYVPDRDESWWRMWSDLPGVDLHHAQPSFFADAPMDLARPYIEQWDGETKHTWGGEFLQILWRFGADAIDPVLNALRTHNVRHQELLPILSTGAARLAADWLVRLKTARVSAIAWFDRHGLEAVLLLVPDALGTDKKPRQAAEAALSYIAAGHGLEAVVARAESHGPEAAAAVREIADGDPLEPRGIKLPKPEEWADPILLPQVLLKDGETALPADSVRHLITVLALATPEYPYAGIDIVAETCDAESLARFSWALFELWISFGANAKDGWVLTQLAHFGDDETVRRLTPLIREWPGQSQHKRAVTGLKVLGAIGTEAALRAIKGIADKAKFKGLKDEARQQIDGIAANLGLTAEQLADRLVPDFGLGDDAALVLDYGPRKFTVGFDEQLKPVVIDEDGKRRKSLPKPGAKDDAELAEPAYKRFAQMKKDLRAVASDQVRRLEAAMVDARTWTLEEFRRFFADHALMSHLARRLIWLADVDGERTAFRLAEDRTFTDAEEDELELPDTAVIRIAHPLLLDPEAIKAWSQILADYEILQPFDQLSRPVMAFTEDELATGKLTRFDDIELETGAFLGLTKQGWVRTHPEDAGIEPGLYYPLPGGGSLVMLLNEGLWAGAMEHVPPQTFELRWSTAGFHEWKADPEAAKAIPARLDPVTASELLLMLDKLVGARRDTGS